MKVLLIGHSHIVAVSKAFESDAALGTQIHIDFLNLRDPDLRLAERQSVKFANLAEIERRISACGDIDLAVLYISGNEHNAFGLLRDEDAVKPGDLKALDTYFKHVERLIAKRAASVLTEWIDVLLPQLKCPVVLLQPPPPIADEQRIRQRAKVFAKKLATGGIVNPPGVRLGFWKQQLAAIQSVAEKYRLGVVEVPAAAISHDGLLAEKFNGGDPTHANEDYGRLVVQRLSEAVRVYCKAVPGSAPMAAMHPYANLPDHCFWKQSVSEVDMAAVDPVTHPRFVIGSEEKVATAGSCFAQHISRHLRNGGFQFLVTEPSENKDGQASGQAEYSARYGNVYTARQLVQLFDRAFGYYKPIDAIWQRTDGRYCDAFRPRIEADGYPSREAVLEDQRRHLEAVREMFRELDVFIFTLGLTECWMSRLDGAAYPLAPGVVGGTYDAQRHAFVNFSVADVGADLRAFLAKLKLVNPRARVILTVSPVPLVATAEDRHVLVSSTYSKAVLRVAAAEIEQSHGNVCYFPSFEVITGAHANGEYFGPDRRNVTERGVAHAMRIFMSRYTRPNALTELPSAPALDVSEMEALAEAACDEEMLAR